MKIKPKVKKYPNGGRPQFEWSKGIDNIQPITQTQNNSSITTGNKKLSTEELKKAAEYTKKYNQQHLEEEYNNRQNKLKQSIDAQKQPLSLKNLQTQTQSTGDKFSLAMNSKYGNPKDYPTLSGYMQGLDYINPAKMIGDMTSGLGSVPQDVNDGNYLKAVLSVASPLFTGAVAGIGTQGLKPFVNNLVNPSAGTGDLINNLGNKYLPNAYKYNPWAFKPNPEAFYRQVGKSAYDDAITKGKVFSKGQENMLERVPELNYLDEYNKSITLDKTGKFNLTKPLEAPFVQKGELFFPINRKPTGKGYKGTKYADAEYLLEGKLPNEAVLPRYQQKYFPTLKESSNVGVIRPEFNELNNFNVYKRDWLKGYKQINVPKQQFKSEIDWAKWNKEIPENKALMQEYNAIEQTTKANGSWMKNSDGSVFQGTPEQFVQQNSQNFKKAFPEYHGEILNHNTNAELNTIDESFFNKGAGDTGYYGKGTYTHPKKDYTKMYGKNNHEFYLNSKNKGFLDKSNINDAEYFKRSDDEILQHHLPEYENKLMNYELDPSRYYDNAKENWLNKLNEQVKAGKISRDKLDEFTSLHNPKNGEVVIPFNNRVKSAVGNNGMFDMTNPNIYKTLVPGVIGLGAASQIDKKQNGGNITRESEWELVNETNKKLPKRRLNLNKSSDWEIVD